MMNLRGNLFILPAIGYSIALLVYYVMYGRLLQFLPALFFLGAIPLLVVLGASRQMAKYWIPFVTIMLSYEALAGIVGSYAASKGVYSLYPIDRAIWGFNVTGWVQSTFSSPVVTEITTFFYTLHFPLIVITCVVLWYAGRKIFGKYMVTMIMTSYASLVTFILIPTAPPWYQGVAVDLYQSASAATLPSSLTSFMFSFESDKFAAFPSLHAAYAIVFSYFMIKLDRRLAFVAIPITVGILFSTLYLGQHYLIDLVGGAVYALIPCLISEKLNIQIPSPKEKSSPSTEPSAVTS
jgi:membrane-associated phospholipid phosphatase